MVVMTPRPVAEEHQATFQQLNEVRAAALEHARKARELSDQRRALITVLLQAGYSQSDIAREMGVSRQAVRKMISLG
jgi:DNA-directed RNA polymerase specialized sigma24 family protein